MRAWMAIVAVLVAGPAVGAPDLSEAAFERSDDKLCMGNTCVREQRDAYDRLVRDHAKAKGKWRQTLEDVVESQTHDGVTDWAMVERMRPDHYDPTPRAGWTGSSEISTPGGGTSRCETHISGDGRNISTKCY